MTGLKPNQFEITLNTIYSLERFDAISYSAPFYTGPGQAQSLMGYNEGNICHSFDFIWTWGVIHLSSNTRKILEEIHRVLRPGGIAITMVYHRNLWNYYIANGLFRGILRGDFLRTKSLHKIVQWHSDGAVARYYTIREWKSLVSDIFLVKKVAICVSKKEIIPPISIGLKRIILSFIPDRLGRFFTNRIKMGLFLVSMLSKR